jgi:membrane-anchored protein YejM (alkaline phosphatase superfamily)
MHITNKQFALILKENSEDINNVVHLLQTSIKVLKKYGQNVFAKEYMEAITHVDKDLGKILISLNHA